MKALIGTKLGMTSIIEEDGTVIAVTVIQAGPVTVTQIKNNETDGYMAVQIAYGKAKTINKAQQNHNGNPELKPKKVKEIRGESELSVGDTIDVTVFSKGDNVKVSGISKGHGFTGTIKRHNFKRGPKTHGSRNYRKPGSIGSMYPQKIFKGKRMSGRSGHDNVTVRNLKVVYIDTEHNLLGISGAIPGPRKGLVSVEAI